MRLAELQRILSQAAGCDVHLQVPRHPSQGHLSTPVALRQDAPMAVARRLAEAAGTVPEVASAEAVPPGFVNIALRPQVFGDMLGDLLHGPDPPDPPCPTPELSWALERRAGAIKMASSRGLWPVPWRSELVHRLTLPVERQLVVRVTLMPDDVATVLRLFHEFYARAPVLALETELATARLGLMEATVRAVSSRGTET